MVGWGQNGGTWDYMRIGRFDGGIITPAVLNVPAMSFIDAAAIGNASGLFLGLDAQGRPLLWGDTNSGLITCHQLPGGSSFTQPYTPTGLTGITQIAGGNLHVLFRHPSGAVYGCGVNGNGELADGTTLGTDSSSTPPKPGPVTAGVLPTSLYTIAAGTYSSAAIAANGDVYTWGRASGGLSGQGDGTLPASNTRAVKLAINTGAIASSPATYAGTQSGPLTTATIDVGVAVEPAHVGQTGQVYVAVLLSTGAFLVRNQSGNYVSYTEGPIPPTYAGALPKRMPIHLIRDFNLSGIAGATLFVGYGLGTGTAADTDMLTNNRFSGVVQLQ